MCGVIPLIAVGAAVAATAAVKSGIDQRNAAKGAARDAKQSAEEEARDRIQRAATDAGDIAAQGARVAATQTAIMGGSNVTGGTTEGAVRESAINAGRDEAMVKSNAAREAWGLRRQASRQASGLKKQGNAALVNGLLGATGSVIGAAGSAAAYAGRYTGPKT